MEQKLQEISMAFNFLIGKIKIANKMGAYELEESHQIREVEIALSKTINEMAQLLQQVNKKEEVKSKSKTDGKGK